MGEGSCVGLKIILTTGYEIRCETYEEIQHEVPAVRVIKNGKEEIVPKFMIAEIKGE